jgi:elongation factor P hydroxylase
MAIFRGNDNCKHLQSTFWYHTDGRDVSEANVEFTEVNRVLDECVVFRLHGSVKFVVQHDKNKGMWAVTISTLKRPTPAGF